MGYSFSVKVPKRLQQRLVAFLALEANKLRPAGLYEYRFCTDPAYNHGTSLVGVDFVGQDDFILSVMAWVAIRHGTRGSDFKKRPVVMYDREKWPVYVEGAYRKGSGGIVVDSFGVIHRHANFCGMGIQYKDLRTRLEQLNLLWETYIST